MVVFKNGCIRTVNCATKNIGGKTQIPQVYYENRWSQARLWFFCWRPVGANVDFTILSLTLHSTK